jgi:hypothetical protein
MTTSGSKQTTRMSIRVRLPGPIRVEGANGSLELALAVEKAQLVDGDGWLELQLEGALAGGDERFPIALLVEEWRGSGVLAGAGGSVLPMTVRTGPNGARATLGQPAGSTARRVRVRIPARLQQEPVLSDLVAGYGLSVNIRGALLGTDADQDGWFDLELRGTPTHLSAGLSDLSARGVQVLPHGADDGWYC